MKKVYLGMPSYDATIFTACAKSLIHHSKKGDILIEFFNGDSLITRIRNKIITDYYKKFAKSKEFDYFLFQDGDVETDENALTSMIERNVDVVFSPIPFKNLNYQSPYGLVQTVIGIEEEVEPYFYKAKLAATGLGLLSNNAVISLIEHAKQNDDFYFDGAGMKIYDVFKTYKNKKGFFFSEDWHICKTLREIGFDIHIDSSFSVAHWSSPESVWIRPACKLSENVLNKNFLEPLPENIKNQRWVTNDFTLDLDVIVD